MRPNEKPYDMAECLRFLKALMSVSAAPCAEMSVFHATWQGREIVAAQQYSKTLAGWYDAPDKLAAEASRLRYVSGFVSVNPVKPALLARSNNAIVKQKHRTTDGDIASLSWMFLDIDPVRPADISSTDEELAAAVARRDEILEVMEGARPSAMWGKSGNGAWILVRLPDYPNDAAHRDLVAQAVQIVAARFTDKVVKIDTATTNPARVMGLIGSLKCKGSDMEDRPFRRATIDCPPGHEDGLVAFNTALWVGGQGRTWIPDPTPQHGPARGLPANAHSVYDRARAYLSKIAPAVAGQQGSSQCFDAACSLVLGFGLSVVDARPLLKEWSNTCSPPWTDRELDHKLSDAEKRGGTRGYLLGQESGPPTAPWFTLDGDPATHGGAAAEVAVSPLGESVPEGMEDNPHRLARRFIAERYNHPDCTILRYWRSDFWVWDGAAYRVVGAAEIRSEVTRSVEAESLRLYGLALLRAAGDEGKKGEPPIPFRVTTRLVSDVIQAIAGLSLLRESECPEQPQWVGGGIDWSSKEILPAQNAIVHLPGFAAGAPEFWREPTPQFFCPYSLAYDFDPEAPEPTEWLSFLQQLWPDKPDCIDALQEWMGLQLVPDTSHQKIACLIGPPRSGKGTIARVMQAMVGAENCAGPTLSSFSNNFGLAPLIGKLCAVIDDARLSHKSDQAEITERLLTISGEGRLTIDRKHRESWTGRLTSRITIISNELPRLRDDSTALANRFLLIPFERSFLGEEDTKLEERLLRELSGILLWALDGLRRLRDVGRFTVPASGEELLNEMSSLSSPVSQFVKDCCEPATHATVEVLDLYEAWCAWCQEQGKRDLGDTMLLGRSLRSVVPGLKTVQRRAEGTGKRLRMFQGLRIVYNPAIAPLAVVSDLEADAGPPTQRGLAIPF